MKKLIVLSALLFTLGTFTFAGFDRRNWKSDSGDSVKIKQTLDLMRKQKVKTRDSFKKKIEILKKQNKDNNNTAVVTSLETVTKDISKNEKAYKIDFEAKTKLENMEYNAKDKATNQKNIGMIKEAVVIYVSGINQTGIDDPIGLYDQLNYSYKQLAKNTANLYKTETNPQQKELYRLEVLKQYENSAKAIDDAQKIYATYEVSKTADGKLRASYLPGTKAFGLLYAEDYAKTKEEKTRIYQKIIQAFTELKNYLPAEQIEAKVAQKYVEKYQAKLKELK